MSKFLFKLKCYFIINQRVKAFPKEVIQAWDALSFWQKINVSPITLNLNKKISEVFYKDELEVCYSYGMIPIVLVKGRDLK